MIYLMFIILVCIIAHLEYKINNLKSGKDFVRTFYPNSSCEISTLGDKYCIIIPIGYGYLDTIGEGINSNDAWDNAKSYIIHEYENKIK